VKKPYAITLDHSTSLSNKTGSWRTERPVYVDRLSPCSQACPAGEDVQGWLYHAEEGDYESAWRLLVEQNPFPAIMGRVCYRPCQTACNRGELDEPVGINAVERFLGDAAIDHGWNFGPLAPLTGKRVLVIGAGPSGLSAAYHLRRLGHAVTIRDAGARAGGMMRFGIPKYRLPRDVLDAEIDRIAAMDGIELELNSNVTSLDNVMTDEGFDAVFIAIGAQVSKHVDIPSGDAAHVMDAVSLLRTMEGEQRPLLGRHVAVYGGGNTAMDAARTAKRLGATETVVVYRRTRERMPAHDVEVEEALEEGIKMRWLSTITRADQKKIVVERMELDGNGFPQPTGEFDELDADTVILAVGQDVDLSLLNGVEGIAINDGTITVDGGMMTGHAGIFAGGDMTPGERTVTVGIGNGERAAKNIDAWLRGAQAVDAPTREVATYEMLNTWYYSDAPHQVRPKLEGPRRQSTFAEVVQGLDEKTALFEARRCFSCGNCFECDNCYGVCPDNAVIKLGPGKRFAFDYDYCKGCGICAAECPAGAIAMVPEQI